MRPSLKDLFVDREDEVAALRSQVRREGLQVVLLSGPGGIGKTHLLRHLDVLFADEPEVLVAPIIDFDEARNRVTRLIGQRLATDLGGEHFSDYFQALRDLDVITGSGQFDAQRIDEEEQRVNAKFFDGYERLAEERRILLRLDTYEKVLGFGVGRELRERLGPRLSNTVVVVAGRELEALVDELSLLYGEGNVMCLSLEPFTAEGSAKFFGQVDLDGRLDDALRLKIEFLAEGRPILLGLAAEWLRHGVPLPEMMALSLAELQALSQPELSELRQRFEFELVGAIRALRQPRDQAVLYMAHFDRRCNAPMLAILMDRPADEIEPLLGELRELFFVKPQPRLQDEMSVLVNRHVWPYVDRNGTVRADLTRRIVDEFYESRLSALDDELERSKQEAVAQKRLGMQMATREEPAWEKWILETEQLHLLLWLDVHEGYRYFSEKFEQAVRGNYLARCELLLDELGSEEWVESLEENPDLGTNLRLKRARFLARSAIPEGSRQAESACREILKRRSISVQNRLEAWSTLGGITSELDEKVRCYEHSIRLARRLESQRLVDEMALALGWAHRQAGHWRQAASWYRRALRSFESQHPLDFWAIASTYNNLAYVHRLLGDVDRALELGETALRLRESHGTERDLALSYRTLGQIWSDQRDTWKAKELFERAAEIFERLEARQDLAETYVNIANIHRQQHHPRQVEEYLGRAIEVLVPLEDYRGLADAYGEYGCEWRKRGRERSRIGEGGAEEAFARSQAFLDKAIEYAEGAQDWYRLVDALVDTVLLLFYRGLHHGDVAGMYQEAENFLARAGELSDDCPFVLFQGRIQELRGDFLLEMGQVREAYLQHYAPAFAILAGYSSARYQETSKRVVENLWELELSPLEMTDLCDQVIQFCRNHPKRRHLAPLVRVCEKVKRLKGDGSVG